MSTEVRELTTDDEALLTGAPEGVFDHPVNEKASRAFLAEPNHHIVGAIDDGQLVGFVSLMLQLHPDKAHPECFVRQLAVRGSYRNRGIGRQLLDAALDIARKAGCAEAWVLTEHVNRIARRLYNHGGGVEAEEAPVMVSFSLRD